MRLARTASAVVSFSVLAAALGLTACAAPTDQADVASEETGSTSSELKSPIFGVEKTLTITSDQLSGSLLLALAGTRIQVDHGTSGPVLTGAPVFVPSSGIPPYKLEQLGCDEPGREDDCLDRLGSHPGTWVTPKYHSYVKWGAALHAFEPTLQDKPFYVPVLEKDIAGPGGIKVSVNNLNVVLGPQTMSSGIAGGKVFLDLTPTSGQPTLWCEHTFPLLGCPDIRLTNMKLHVDLSNLAATKDGKSIEYGNADVDFNANVDLNNVPDSLVNVFFDVKGAIVGAVESKLRAKLGEADVKKAVGKAIVALVESRLPAGDKPVNKYVSASVVGDQLVVKYRTGAIVFDPGPIVIKQ